MRIERRCGGAVMYYEQDSNICRRLTDWYWGLTFHEVVVGVLGPEALRRYVDDDMVEVGFTLTGSASRLIRCGFARPEWLRPDARNGDVEAPSTDDYCWSVEPRPGGYRIKRARLADGLDKICAVLPLPWWAGMTPR